MNENVVIKVDNLTKTWGPKGIFDISFSIKRRNGGFCWHEWFRKKHNYLLGFIKPNKGASYVYGKIPVIRPHLSKRLATFPVRLPFLI